MSYGRMPGIPRARLRSHADDEPIPERVYEVLKGFDDRIERIEGAFAKNEKDNADILSEVRGLRATGTHVLAKQIVALATTAVVTIGGILGGTAALKPSPAQAPIVVQRSELDKKMDTCRAMGPGASRSECFVRIASEPEQ